MKVVAWILGVVVALAAVITGAAFACDGVLRERVESAGAGILASATPLENPVVRVEGMPVAWHLLTRRFPAVHVSAQAVPLHLQAGDVVLRGVEASATDVRAEPGSVAAGAVTATGLLGYDEVSRLAGVPVSYAGEGRIAASGSMTLLGREVSGTVSGVPVLDASTQSIELEAPTGEASGITVPSQAVASLVNRLWAPVEIALPYGLTLDAVEATPEGLRVAAVGSDLTVGTP